MQILRATLAFRLISLEVLAGIVAMLLCSSPASGQNKPKIRAVFEIDAPLLRLSQRQAIPSMQERLSNRLAGLGNQYLGFLDWSAAREVTRGLDPTPVLTARLVQKSVDF